MTEPAGSVPAADIVDELTAELGPEVQAELTDGEGDGLRVTGLEEIALLLALKAVVGVVSGFVGRAAFDRWKTARSRRQLRELASQLDLDIPGQPLPVDEATLRREVAEELVERGIGASQAERIATAAVDRVRDRLTVGNRLDSTPGAGAP